MKRYFAPSELLIEQNGAIYHLGVKPEQLADKVILVGDPGRVPLVASYFSEQECDIQHREFRTITGTYKGKRITVLSTGIGCDNIDIVVNELDALANINFHTREDNPTFRQLTLVRIGTCGGINMRVMGGDAVIPTGALSLDMALGVGGLPRGRIVECYGQESSGKTTLALHVVANAQKAGGVAAFIDAEHALDPVYARNIGVNIDELYIAQPDATAANRPIRRLEGFDKIELAPGTCSFILV